MINNGVYSQLPTKTKNKLLYKYGDEIIGMW